MKSNTEKAYKIYKKHGQQGVLNAADLGKLKVDYYQFCVPCIWISPIYKACCLVCGSINKKTK